jgi:GH18 family chitinase
MSTEKGLDSTLNHAAAISKWLTEGARPDQLVLGISAYGRTYELEDPTLYTPGSPIRGPALPGKITNESGVLSYFEVIKNINKKKKL